ncbi:hypothetical protein O3P69_015231 [Scylla paramamosain]|uniref:Uncharacterized protein n=1 Tax=Scylla paramamosain TaxID=85552 RepID=A0AAW0T3X6_SCYPA
MSQRGTRPRSWCPRGDSPLRVPETANLPSPVATPGLQGLPPAVASPRSTPTPFKLRRLSMGTERSGSPCAAPPSAATVLPALHMAAAQLEQQQQQQRQAAQQAAQQNTAHTDQNMTPLFKSPTPQQQQQQQQQEQQQQQQQSQQQYRNMTPTPQDGRPQSGVFYPMPQHPASPTPLQQNKEPRSPPSSRPGSVVFRERDIWSPPSSRPSSAMSREKDLRSPPPAFKPTPFLHSERDFRSPTPSRPFPFRQKEREPWSPTRPSPLAQRDRDPLSPPMGRPSPLTYERFAVRVWAFEGVTQCRILAGSGFSFTCADVLATVLASASRLASWVQVRRGVLSAECRVLSIVAAKRGHCRDARRCPHRLEAWCGQPGSLSVPVLMLASFSSCPPPSTSRLPQGTQSPRSPQSPRPSLLYRRGTRQTDTVPGKRMGASSSLTQCPVPPSPQLFRPRVEFCLRGGKSGSPLTGFGLPFRPYLRRPSPISPPPRSRLAPNCCITACRVWRSAGRRWLGLLRKNPSSEFRFVHPCNLQQAGVESPDARPRPRPPEAQVGLPTARCLTEDDEAQCSCYALCSVTVRSVTLSDCLLALHPPPQPHLSSQRRKQFKMPSVFMSTVDVRTANVATGRQGEAGRARAGQRADSVGGVEGARSSRKIYLASTLPMCWSPEALKPRGIRGENIYRLASMMRPM